MTFEDAARLDPKTQPGEIIRGKWVPVTRNTWRHGTIVINVGAILREYARKHGGYSVSGADPGTKLSRNPDTLRGPDVGIIRSTRKPKGKGAKGWLEGAPDVAVEVAGDRQTVSSLLAKAYEYLGAGGKAVWILEDDQGGRVLVVTAPDRVRVLGAGDVLDGGKALPGFSCQVRELFE